MSNNNNEVEVKEEDKKKNNILTKYLIGDVGGDAIRQMLASTESPSQAIENFRLTNGLQSPLANAQSFLSVLELIDLHDIRRADVYKDLLSGLLSTLLTRIDTISPEKRDALLKVSFPFVGIEELRKLPFAILQQTKVIRPPFLRQLGANEELYKVCPIEVKRQIWEMDEAIFLKETQPLLDLYITHALTNADSFSSFQSLPPKKRREKNEVLQQIVRYIGDSLSLYKMMIKYCTSLFLTTGHTHFCTLRAEILMLIHDLGISSIYENDACHKFAWCLDACVGDNRENVEIRRIREIENLLQQVPPGSPLIGDLAIIMADSFAINSFVRNLFITLVDVVNRETTPKNDETLKVITHIASLGLEAHSIVQTRDFKIPKADKEILNTFYISCTNRLLDDKLRQSGIDIPQTQDESLEAFFFSNKLARKIILYYLITRVEAGDESAIDQFLPLLSKLPQYINDNSSLFHSFSSLAAVSKNTKIRETVLQLMVSNKDSFLVHIELLFFISHANSKMSLKELTETLQLVCDYHITDHKEAKIIEIVVSQLIEKVKGRLNDKNAPFLFHYFDTLQAFSLPDDEKMAVE